MRHPSISPRAESGNRAGFSLVELSIVLVILGLLVGGILGGQSLIHAAELRAIGEEYHQWQTAVNTFKTKYFAIPGDMRNAEDFWKDSGGNPVSWNGNGDGKIDYADNPLENGEIFTFWQQLSLAGLISGKYTGVAGSGTELDSTVGENVPGSKYSGGGWSVLRIDDGAPGPDDYDLEYGSLLQFGSKIPDWEMGGKILTPEDAWNVDTKFDDSRPAEGKIIARYWDDECAGADDGGSSQSDFEASYRLSDTSNQCALFFRKAF